MFFSRITNIRSIYVLCNGYDNCWNSDYLFETKHIVLETLAGNLFFFLYQKYMISGLTFKIQTKIDSVSFMSSFSN